MTTKSTGESMRERIRNAFEKKSEFCEQKYLTPDTYGILDEIIEQETSRAVMETVKQCYLECLREEYGEGQCAEAIRTKFNLITPQSEGEDNGK